MAKKDVYEARTEALLEPIAAANGCEIYDVEYVKEGSDWYLRAYIDKAGGVSIADCEAVSRALSDRLDAEDFIPDAYILEVSSPGLGRALKKDRHLEKSIGREVEVKTYKPIEQGGVKQKEFTGILKAFDKDTVTIEPEDRADALVFTRVDIAVIRLALDF
ncbi:MAG: ribosome maturation factor RimP [Roseburia sp.]|nr:ribosome maturation factor RimP [Roseburia sp.]